MEEGPAPTRAEPAGALPAQPPVTAVPTQIAPTQTVPAPSAPSIHTVPIRVAPGPPIRPQAEDARYGPGVPAVPPAGPAGPAGPVGPAGWAAEQVWRTGRPPEPPSRPRRLRRLRRLAGSALTVALLAASGVVLFLRFHHVPFRVTGVAISEQTPVPCGVDLTGRITTNGAAGTVSYEWLFGPRPQPPRPGSQSLIAGQDAVYVIEPVVATGHGRASERVTLQITGPDRESAITVVVLSC